MADEGIPRSVRSKLGLLNSTATLPQMRPEHRDVNKPEKRRHSFGTIIAEDGFGGGVYFGEGSDVSGIKIISRRNQKFGLKIHKDAQVDLEHVEVVDNEGVNLIVGDETEEDSRIND